MDLHQGDNEYRPLRSKPTTAAMQQDQKHIEGSVYDPTTGKTVVSRRCSARLLSHGIVLQPLVRAHFDPSLFLETDLVAGVACRCLLGRGHARPVGSKVTD